MINIVTYHLRYDLDSNHNVIIQNESFDDMMTVMMNRRGEIKITLVDRFGIANSKIDDIVNEFIKDCRQKDGHRYCPYVYNDRFAQFSSVLKSFIGGLIKEVNSVHVREFEVFNRKETVRFKVDIPDEYVTEEKREEFIGLGANDLFAEPFSSKVILENVMPAFYVSLYDTNRLSDKSDETNLFMFKIGLN